MADIIVAKSPSVPRKSSRKATIHRKVWSFAKHSNGISKCVKIHKKKFKKKQDDTCKPKKYICDNKLHSCSVQLQGSQKDIDGNLYDILDTDPDRDCDDANIVVLNRQKISNLKNFNEELKVCLDEVSKHVTCYDEKPKARQERVEQQKLHSESDLNSCSVSLPKSLCSKTVNKPLDVYTDENKQSDEYVDAIVVVDRQDLPKFKNLSQELQTCLGISHPLQCPECPMQFCTVRSLFWHFSIHTRCSRGCMQQNSSLLENLSIPWSSTPTNATFLGFPDLGKNIRDSIVKSLQSRDIFCDSKHNFDTQFTYRNGLLFECSSFKQTKLLKHKKQKLFSNSLLLNSSLNEGSSCSNDGSEVSVIDKNEYNSFKMCNSDLSSDIDNGTLVMINPNLGIRILSSLPEENLNENTNYLSDEDDSSKDSLIITPQSKNYVPLANTGRQSPDILTIVPQLSQNRNKGTNGYTSSCKSRKKFDFANEFQSFHLMLPKGKEVNQVSDLSTLNLENKMSDETDSESDKLVIDIPENSDDEDNQMDPLSLCSVSLEEVNHEKKCEQDYNEYRKRKYVCPHCNRRFGWSTDLKRHVILHTGEKPFQCKMCSCAYTRKFLLQNHIKKIHVDQYKMSDIWPSDI